MTTFRYEKAQFSAIFLYFYCILAKRSPNAAFYGGFCGLPAPANERRRPAEKCSFFSFAETDEKRENHGRPFAFHTRVAPHGLHCSPPLLRPVCAIIAAAPPGLHARCSARFARKKSRRGRRDSPVAQKFFALFIRFFGEFHDLVDAVEVVGVVIVDVNAPLAVVADE